MKIIVAIVGVFLLIIVVLFMDASTLVKTHEVLIKNISYGEETYTDLGRGSFKATYVEIYSTNNRKYKVFHKYNKNLHLNETVYINEFARRFSNVTYYTFK